MGNEQPLMWFSCKNVTMSCVPIFAVSPSLGSTGQDFADEAMFARLGRRPWSGLVLWSSAGDWPTAPGNSKSLLAVAVRL